MKQGVYPHPIPCQSCPVLAQILSVPWCWHGLAVSLLVAAFCSRV